MFESFLNSRPETAALLLGAGLLNLGVLCYFGSHVFRIIQKSKGLDEFAGGTITPAKDVLPTICRLTACTAVFGILLALAQRHLIQRIGAEFLSSTGVKALIIYLAMAMSVITVGATYLLRKVGGTIKIKTSQLANLKLPANSIFIGSVESDDDSVPELPVIMGEAALGGNILVTGSIGTGKTQGTILPYFEQILQTFDPPPAVLAIDPKGSFIREAVIMATARGYGDKVRRLELGGSVSINPIYAPNALKNGRFVEIAEMIQAAASNFSGDQREQAFWKLSSFNLIKNCLVYVAATQSYYTLRDLHKALISSSEPQFVDELEVRGREVGLDPEVKENIDYAVEYFGQEFNKFDDKVRTGILATATAFLHQFQESQAARIFCPKEEDCTIKSIDEVVDQGLFLYFDVKNPGLARAMGTFVKLLFQQSVLNRIANVARPADRAALLIIDEYQDVATTGSGKALGDERFLAKAREAIAVTIVATQSLSSLETTLGQGAAVKELRQNFRSMICLHSSDSLTTGVFQQLVGEEERERISRGYSEQERDPRAVLNKQSTNVTQSVNKSMQKESAVNGQIFNELAKFEAMALIYDGHRTRFIRKLRLKPFFLQGKRPTHKELTKLLCQGIKVIALTCLGGAPAALAFPNICDVVSAPAFNTCLEYSVSACVCPLPKPHLCVSFSYYAPATFVEVTDEQADTVFRGLPGVMAQLPSAKLSPTSINLPFGTEGEDFSAFQARTLAIPFSDLIFKGLPCKGGAGESTCFGAMSEHLGPLWTTGIGDRLQPNYLAWLASPKACLSVGLARSAVGGGAPFSSAGSPACSLPLARLPAFPPSSHEACNGWGLFYPRVGMYDGPSQTTAALMVAARMKSLSSEVFHSAPSSADEKWQMIRPSQSQCFREGQNVGLLETAGLVNDRGRLSGHLKNYLFAVWERRSCCHEYADVAAATAMLASLKAACQGAGGATK